MSWAAGIGTLGASAAADTGFRHRAGGGWGLYRLGFTVQVNSRDVEEHTARAEAVDGAHL